jgi:hypothetical protein
VRVAVTEGPGNFWILPRLIDFQKTYRKITVDLRCAMEQADVVRLETDIAIQFERPTNPDLIAARLGRLHIYPFVSEGYRKLLRRAGDAGGAEEPPHHQAECAAARRHRLCAHPRPYLAGRRRRHQDQLFHRRTLCGRSAAPASGFLPTASVALGAPLIPVDMGVCHHTDLWITYHKEFRNSERHKIVIDWLKRIFDPRTYPCFRDEFIHPNDLVPLMQEARENFGLRGMPRRGRLEMIPTQRAALAQSGDRFPCDKRKRLRGDHAQTRRPLPLHFEACRAWCDSKCSRNLPS